MPCRYYTEGEERAMAEQIAAKLRTDLDRLTSENDRLRELVIHCVENQEVPVVPVDFMKQISRDQAAHRQEDLDRCKKTITDILSKMSGSATPDPNDYWPINGQRYNRLMLQQMLGAVITADPKHPLEPQLGFDPDSI